MKVKAYTRKYVFNDKCSNVENPHLSTFHKQKYYSKSAPVYIHIDHKFTHGLGHAFDIYGIAIAISLRYNFTIIYEPLLHDHTHGNHSISYHSVQSNDFDFLGLQLETENRSYIESKHNGNLVLASLNQPCSSYTFDRALLKKVSSVPIDDVYAKIDDILKKRDAHKPLLIQGCGFPISYKFLVDHIDIYDYWRSRMEQYAYITNNNENYSTTTLFHNSSKSSFFYYDTNMDSSNNGNINHGYSDNYRNIAVHIRRGDFLLPIYHQRLLPDDYYVEIICRLLSILDNDKINRFTILSESSVEQQQDLYQKGNNASLYIDEKSKPSNLSKKIQRKCPSIAKKSKWELVYLIDASVLVTVKTMIYSSFLITSKSGFSR